MSPLAYCRSVMAVVVGLAVPVLDKALGPASGGGGLRGGYRRERRMDETLSRLADRREACGAVAGGTGGWVRP